MIMTYRTYTVAWWAYPSIPCWQNTSILVSVFNDNIHFTPQNWRPLCNNDSTKQMVKFENPWWR